MTDRELKQVKILLDSFPRGEFGLHDTISALNAIAKIENINTFISLYKLAKDMTWGISHNEAVKHFNTLDITNRRIVIWCLTNLYTREIYSLIKTKQHITKLLRIHGKV